MKNWLFLALLVGVAHAQQLAPLTVDKIMRDPAWIGSSPSAVYWSDDGKSVYFNWNPERNAGDSLYSISVTDRTPKKVSSSIRRALPPSYGVLNRARTKKLFEKDGDLFLLDIPSGKTIAITNTVERESNVNFSYDENEVLFVTGGNLFSWNIPTGTFSQRTDFQKGIKKPERKPTDQEAWLKNDQLAYFQVLKKRSDTKKHSDKARKAERPKRPKEIYIDDRTVDEIQLSADQKFITYRLSKSANPKSTIVPSYVTESGYTEDIPTRTKSGAPQSTAELFVYDLVRDTVLQVKTDSVPGIADFPDYKKDYATKISKEDNRSAGKKPEPRPVLLSGPINSPDGKSSIVIIRSIDNKDRWIMSLDLPTQKLSLLYRQRDEAWIGGPGSFGSRSVGWLADNKTIWFQSEESGYSHLYLVDVTTKTKRALTSGKFEVQSVQLSNDKKFFYITTNEVHPGEKQFYKLPVTGGKPEKLTSLTGAHEVVLSPDEKWMAYRYSYSNRPWELYLQENKPGAKPQQLTQSLTDEFKSYPWRDPEVLTIKARDGAEVYSRLFKPAQPNGAAVIFVHGAGYLQNAHKWWSSYFREYMFHNLLADKGYTVLDMDYRASAGYGRDWRTGIYRFMGGKDLTDHLDGAKWLADNQKVDPRRIGIYGGSYGGFITLMAMFTAPDVFAAGAALRPVTNWAHYNDSYTPNILNEPYRDSIAYAKSSPIYYASGLKGSLLICHGMIDTNVHFQDAVMLSQRLIELGKDNWELAVYPMEDHGFVEPSSWTDEYKRILKLFDTKLGKL